MLKVVSLNLWNGGRLFEAAKNFLVEQKADLYFLQEAYDGHQVGSEERFRTVELLQAQFPAYEAFFAPAYLDLRAKEGPTPDGNLLLSRWPLHHQENIFIDIPYGEYDQDATTDFSKFPAGFQKAVIEVNGKKTTLLNVHGPVNLNGTQDDERRLQFKDRILAEAGESTILAGDFNVRPQTQTIQALEQRFTSVFGRELPTTFNTQRKDLVKFPGYADSPVDMFFVTQDWQVVTKNCPQVDVSDHLPLVVELSG